MVIIVVKLVERCPFYWFYEELRPLFYTDLYWSRLTISLSGTSPPSTDLYTLVPSSLSRGGGGILSTVTPAVEWCQCVNAHPIPVFNRWKYGLSVRRCPVPQHPSSFVLLVVNKQPVTITRHRGDNTQVIILIWYGNLSINVTFTSSPWILIVTNEIPGRSPRPGSPDSFPSIEPFMLMLVTNGFGMFLATQNKPL